jgi:hypothetical protein
VGASLARNTWKRYNSALRQWEKFRHESGADFELLDVETWEKNFLIWGWRDRGLNVSTLQIYLSELRELGRLARGLETMGQDLGKTLIRGMKNLATPGKTDHISTEPLTITDLRKVREGLEKFDQKLTGQSVWACCLVAFWGAFRLGELLGNDTVNFANFQAFSGKM